VEEWTQIYEWCLQQGNGRVDTYMNSAYRRAAEEWTQVHEEWYRRAVEEWTQVHEEWYRRAVELWT
jgi:phosphohistidine phosphatase SixA